MLTGLPFCRNVAEINVTGQMTTYFRGNGIIPGSLSPYTVIVIWGATLIVRLLITFVIPIKSSYSTMIRMGIGCIIFCMGLMMASTQATIILLLFAFAFTIAGMNPTTVASTGHMTSAASMGIMLPAASGSVAIMPRIVDIVSEYASIETGMTFNIIPCAGMLLFSAAVKRSKE